MKSFGFGTTSIFFISSHSFRQKVQTNKPFFLLSRSIILMAAAAAQVNCSYPIQIIDENGNFNANIGQCLNLGNDNGRIAAVSIFGPQNGGKSTLMNECFSTDFKVMDASNGIHGTTRGIWIAKWTSSDCRNKILIVDTEGSDGSKREGDDRFEKQLAVFVLTISTTLIFNMKCDDVDKYKAGYLPLLQTVFEVMVRKFNTPRKINLLFVLRDKNESPLEKLIEPLIEKMHKMWNEKIKPQAQANAIAALEDYFNIEVMAMPHYKYEKEEFIKEVGNLREEIISHSTSAPLGIPASVFTDYARKNWDEIKEDRILNLQLNMITMTEAYCYQIAEKNNQNFRENESWLQIKKDVESRVRVEGFGNNISSLIDNCLSENDNGTQGIDTIKRGEIRQQLTEKLVQVVEPTYLQLLDQMRIATLAKFENAAMDELSTTGVLVAIQTHSFIREFDDQLPDVAVRQSNWNHNSVAISKLESEMASFMDGVSAANQKLQHDKRDQREFWLNMAWIGSKTLLRFGLMFVPGGPIITALANI